MPSKRFFVTTLPIEHINGKIAPIAVKCTDTDDAEHLKAEGFFYGYRRKISPVSRFGCREYRRNLNVHPYTPEELQNRALFTTSLRVVHSRFRDFDEQNKMYNEFRKQKVYKTLFGYAVWRVYTNGGVWPF